MTSPFPEGWYFVASRQTISNAKLIRTTWMGEDIVACTDDDGCVCMADAYCPHLGADLGPVSSGRICEGRLVCPFHGYEFDALASASPFPLPNRPRPRSCEFSGPRKFSA